MKNCIDITTILVLASLFFAYESLAQLGGRNAFHVVQLPFNARLAGLGGLNISTSQVDVNFMFQNPALLTSELHRQASFSYGAFYGGIKQTALTYSHTFDKIGTWGAGLQYLNYGTLQQTNEAGDVLGSFQVSDYALHIAHSHTLDNFRLGITSKLIGSQMASYNAFALAFDVGGVFKHPLHDFQVALALKNIGFPLRTYLPAQAMPLPFEAQVATSFKPKNMPFRFSLTYQHLQRWDITYLDPTIITLDLNGQPVRQQKKFWDNLLRHWVVGGELIIHKSFVLNMGYNHLTNRELRLLNTNTFAGFAWGFALKVKAWEVIYGRAIQHAAGAANYFTLTANLGKLKPKPMPEE